MYSRDEFLKRLLTGTTLNYETIWNEKQIKFDIMPTEFLKYAEESLSKKEKGYLVNALSNSKRALDSQVELIVYEYGYGGVMKKERWNFLQKIKFLKDRHIIAPRLLEKINRTRNLLEHEFKKPLRENVEDTLDVVILFIGYCKQLRRIPDCIRLGLDESTTKSLSVFFRKKKAKFDVFDDSKKLFSVEEKDKEFERLLQLFHGVRPATYTLMSRNEMQDKNY